MQQLQNSIWTLLKQCALICWSNMPMHHSHIHLQDKRKKLSITIIMETSFVWSEIVVSRLHGVIKPSLFGGKYADVKALDVDMMSCSAHKFNGPKGIGFLFIKKGTMLSAYADGGVQEFGLRAGTENIAAIVGMSVALQKNVPLKP